MFVTRNPRVRRVNVGHGGEGDNATMTCVPLINFLDTESLTLSLRAPHFSKLFFAAVVYSTFPFALTLPFVNVDDLRKSEVLLLMVVM